MAEADLPFLDAFSLFRAPCRMAAGRVFCRVGVFPRTDLGRVRVEVQPGHPGNQKNPDGDEGELPLLKFPVIFAGSSAAGFLPRGLPLHVFLCIFFLCCHR